MFVALVFKPDLKTVPQQMSTNKKKGNTTSFLTGQNHRHAGS